MFMVRFEMTGEPPFPGAEFRSTVIVMTSNIGSEYILDASGDDSKYEMMRESWRRCDRTSARNFSNALMTSFLVSTPQPQRTARQHSNQARAKALSQKNNPGSHATRPRLLSGWATTRFMVPPLKRARFSEN